MAKNELKQDLDTVNKAQATIRSEDPSKADINYNVVALVCDKLNIDTLAGRQFVRHALANALLMNRKQHDYGPDNIGDFMTTGVIIRLNDKMQRLKHLFSGGRRRKAVNETIEDNLRDVGNYGIIGQMCESGDWPNE